MKKLLLTTIAILLVSAAFISCKKEKEEIPAQQEQPTTLNQGNGIMETVQRGPNGTNVVFSNWITKIESDWTGFGTMEITTDFNTTSLTSSVRDNGIVLIYSLYNNIARQLPYVSIADDLVLDYSFVTGKMTVKFSYAGSGVIAGIPDQKFRYVLIPSSSFGNGRMNPPVDYSNYNAVCEYYNIQK